MMLGADATSGALLGFANVPNFSTRSRRQKTLAVNIWYRGSQGPLHLLIDSERVKGKGESESFFHKPSPR